MGGRQIVGAVIETVIKVVVYALIIMFVYRYAIEAYDYGYRIFGEEPMDAEPGREVSITVMENTDTKDIGAMMEEKGLIRDAKLFVIQEKLADIKNGIVPGTYEFNTAMTIEEMLEIMRAASEKEAGEE